MSIRNTRRRVLLAAGALSLVALAACAPPTPPPTGNTTTTSANVTLRCSGVGFAASLGTLPDQTVALTVTRPTTVAPGAAYSATADLAPLALRRPNGIDLNAFNIPGTVTLSADAGSIGNAIGTPTAFADTGPLDTVSNSYPASGNIPPGNAAGTAPGSAGTVTITGGTVTIITGSTGFNCVVIGAPPTFALTVA